MKFNRFLPLMAFLSLLNPGMARADLAAIRVVVSDLSPMAGTVEISLFNSAQSYLKEPYLQEAGVPDENGTVEVSFPDLREGEYAVVVVHDANDNGKLDKGFFGLGGESYGYSNGAQGWLGQPSFEKVKVTVTAPETRIEIEL
jgi:uncharacterized protein (DUF2141 family)